MARSKVAVAAPEPVPVDDWSDGMVNAMLAQCFGAVGIKRADGWEWVTDGRGQPRNQKVKQFWCVQVTWEGKGWCWGARTEREARDMAAKMKGLGVRNVRVWRADVEWTAV